ncbi:hypothetical protein GCM10028805_56170 [Spirosoma harenae]
MNLRHKTDKEPIELLLGLAGAVQYLAHTLKDPETYSVWVKTKAGNKHITIPVVAVQQIQFQKPSAAVIKSIKSQLADSLSQDADTSNTLETTTSEYKLWHKLFAFFGFRQ